MDGRRSKVMRCACVASLLTMMSQTLQAQQPSDWQASYTITSEAAAGSGDYTAYQLTANRHDVLSHRANTGYVRAAVDLERNLSNDWLLTGAFDVLASAHAKSSFYLQQLYANLSWQDFYLEVGKREYQPVLRNALLSSGSLVASGNARPMPEVRIGTKDFVTVPGTRQWLQFYFDASYGYYEDSDWLSDCFDDFHALHPNGYVTTEVWHHQKKLFLRSDPTRKLSLTIGMEHAVQFGGRCLKYLAGTECVVDLSPSFGDFFRVIIPGGDGNVGNTYDKTVEWVKGNHIGDWNVMLTYQFDKHHQLSAYLENPFEDGSGIRKGNGWDGLWGIEYKNRNEGTQWVRGVVLEYLQTTDQSGPIHWSPGDFSQMIEGWMPNHATGNDNYYNNYMYNGYAHYGMAMGTPLLMSPIYNRDNYCGFVDTRVQAWHLGIQGELSGCWSYLARGSYREGQGTYFIPFAERHHSLDTMFQLSYASGPWQLSCAYANDSGNIYGDNNTVNIKVSYHGKIF